MIRLDALKKYQWILQSFREAWAQPDLARKLKHLKYRLLWELRPIFRMPGLAPLAVDIEAASLCNFKCTFCQQSVGEVTQTEWWRLSPPKKLMAWETFQKIVDECVTLGVYSMKINWRGEPMLNPHLPEMVRYMKAQGIHEVMMNSNASLLTVENADALIMAGIDRVIFSCDGVSRETYNQIRRGGDWDRFIENVRMFRQRCRASQANGRRPPVVRINVAVMAENRHEIPRFQEIFKNLADELRFNTLYNPQKANEHLNGRTRQQKRQGCPQIYQRMVISTEGDAVPCCADYQKKLKLGNTAEKSIASMYLGEMGEIRKVHEHHLARTLDGCRDCDLFALSQFNNGEVAYT